MFQTIKKYHNPIKIEQRRLICFCVIFTPKKNADTTINFIPFILMQKTQVFNANIGDHYRNRLTHTLEVSQIARSIGKALERNDELIEAIALGHDLGHTPYGHIGERTLNSILRGNAIKEILDQEDGFKHNLQSLRVVDELETRCLDYKGINLTLAVREGIIKHTKVKNKDISG